MPDNSSSEALTRLLQVLGGVGVVGGGLLGWAKHKLEREKQFVELGLMEAQTEEHQANAHKITVDGLIQTALQRGADLERVTRDREHWRERAEAAEAEVERLLREAKARHKMVNELSAHRLRWNLLSQGVPLEKVMAMPVEPIYEDAEGEGE